MNKTKLKLFIWTNFSPDYSSGLAFSIAKNEAEARKLIMIEHGEYGPHDWGDLEIRRLDHRVARCVAGGS